MSSPYVGSTKAWRFTFDVDGTLTDPTTVTVTAIRPSGRTTYTYGVDAALTKLSTGRYKVAVPITESGPWTLVFKGTGAAAEVDTVSFTARADPLA
jgi:hypothetical protein